ncbi:hypothetical protein [Rufibacter sp. DG15C]|uniref:hypothetical protein n=1 Tax=Rufibacter sp. DG15C TaxID=1379909 RepID=UPI0012F91F30|nr:hypothetical protein [Rufibacter sp. DG15C]
MVALLHLLVVASLGLVLRYMMVGTVPGVNYKYLLHAHSHVALLGWLYSAVTVALQVVFLPPEVHSKRTYSWQFWLSQVAVLGMLFSFPVQGYAAVSITFSTAHILLSYWFIYQFLKDAKVEGIAKGQHQVSFLFVQASLFFLTISSLGPWSLGPIMATGHSGSSLYYNAIYFYLHFQYNGWFTFAVLGLVFWLLEYRQIPFSLGKGRAIFWMLFWACLPEYLLSILWTKPAGWVYVLSGIAAVGQLVALTQLIMLLWPQRKTLLLLFAPWSRFLITGALAALALKTCMQVATAFPYFADLAYQIRNFIIGYLHLVLIGFISFFLFAFFEVGGWLMIKTKLSKWGIGLFVLSFLTTEGLLFLQGIFSWVQFGSLPQYHLLLFIASIFLLVGMLLFFLSQLRKTPLD